MSTLITIYTLSPAAHLEIADGDLTQEPVDAIVNAANENLAHGGGVAAAIVRKGGRGIQQESDEWIRRHGRVSHAEPAYTSAGSLPARYVIHAVGPVWGAGDEEAKLASAIQGSLRRAEELRLKSIAFPAISTGIFGFPKEKAAQVFFHTLNTYFARPQVSLIELVRITLRGEEIIQVFVREGNRILNSPGNKT